MRWRPSSTRWRIRARSKAIGEWVNNATAAAIANAVAIAVGCQLFKLPTTAERVYVTLHQVEKSEAAELDQ
jgi:CO/xanthine dehydrogenase Mo-binding subunit